MPSQSYACPKKPIKTEQSSFTKQQSEKSAHKVSCKSEFGKKCGDCNDCNSDCEGNCKHNSCTCGTSGFSFGLPMAAIPVKKHFSEAEKQKFSFRQAYYSSGFISVWLPPKIS